jgi:hypothetical protein
MENPHLIHEVIFPVLKPCVQLSARTMGPVLHSYAFNSTRYARETLRADQ